MMKLRVLTMALLAASSSTVYAGGTVRPAPAEAEAAPTPVPAPLVAPAPVVIYQPTNYVGIGIGASHFRGNCVIDSNDTGYKIFAGRHLTTHLSVELSYVDLGRSNEDLSCLATRAGTGSAAGGSNGGGSNGGGGGSSGGGDSSGGGGSNGGGSSGGSSGSASGSGSSIGTGSGSTVSSSGSSGGSGSTSIGIGGNVNSSGSGSASNTTTSSSSGNGSSPALAPASDMMTHMDPHVRGIDLALVAGMPFYNNAASIYIKGGAFFYHASDDLGGSNNGTSPFYGIGAQYNFGIHHGVRAEYERYHNVGTDLSGKQDVDLASISYIYRF